ncbi:NUDIX domain-containing protein [Phaeocystidibacter marisrubri]|uniref:GDP-mannose pyrophosphatase n=1 Tax=Phaeocystidibacter marisrubri TaxID=1577780 RepID=A0A6L3ZGA6_9FLAO|nr:NUDIX hydrolase [Phaeocystidibacter marisrubri]KAB2816498.1 NUDIX hydrolase [Phaeocystidibacter marisrubri]GGH69354.1 hypothetical protein GCM10011318_10290 [Phaeocystidibacter marisrubri]
MADDKNTLDWKRKSREVQYDNPWITVYHDEVINPNGGDGIYGVVHFKNYAIGILPIDENGYTWLVGQKRYPLDKYTWEIPEGGGLRHIDPLESAKRELREEVGLEAREWKEILRSDISNSATDEQCILYTARDLKKVEIDPDETEVLTLLHLPLAEAIAKVDSGEITDSLSVMALLWMDRYMLRNNE